MAGQCRADTRALDRRCGGPNPQKTAECLAYSKARTGAEPAKAVERHWVQIASGRNKDDMPREWARLKAKAPAVLARRTPYVAAARAGERRGGEEGGSTCRPRGWPCHKKKKSAIRSTVSGHLQIHSRIL